MRLLAALLVLLALAFASGCGSKSSSSAGSGGPGSALAPATPHIHFAKTKFLIHAGLAFGAFHRYLYKPFKAGAFAHPLQHKLALAKAALAALFIVHQVRKASEDARSSATLSRLFSPLSALGASVGALVSRLRAGHADAAALDSANGAIESIEHGSASAGAAVTERAPALP